MCSLGRTSSDARRRRPSSSWASAAAAMTAVTLAPVSPVLALRAVVAVGVAAPLIRFVMLERRVGG